MSISVCVSFRVSNLCSVPSPQQLLQPALNVVLTLWKP